MTDDAGAAAAAAVIAKQQSVDRLTRQLSALTTQESHLQLSLERARMQRMGLTWFLTLVLNVALMFHAYANGSFLLTALNGYTVLINWRALYVRSSAPAIYSYGVAWAVAAFTLKAI
jgi:hypothetical protein